MRAEGRFDPILRQPIKGRKVGGGVRLGEMERDCLLSHGLSFVLHDRLMSSNCDRVKVTPPSFFQIMYLIPFFFVSIAIFSFEDAGLPKMWRSCARRYNTREPNGW